MSGHFLAVILNCLLRLMVMIIILFDCSGKDVHPFSGTNSSSFLFVCLLCCALLPLFLFLFLFSGKDACHSWRWVVISCL
jgi:hypothetical protein